MAAFLTERFPDWVSFGSSGGPTYRTSVIELLSGHEQRQKEWAYPRHMYDVGYGARRQDAMNMLINFYNTAGGRLRAFRYKDWAEYTSSSDPSVAITGTDQILYPAPTDGRTAYQLVKNYTIGAEAQIRLITRPVDDGTADGTVIVAVNGVNLGAGGYSVDFDTGVVTLAAAPAPGDVITAGFEFDVPVRFENDILSHAFESHDNLDAEVKVIEIREGPNVPLT